MLIDILVVGASKIDMICNTLKTVAMVFNPKVKRWVLDVGFPNFTLGNTMIKFVHVFKYLGHVINNRLNDDDDINREIRGTFARTNTLIRKFSKCSLNVKMFSLNLIACVSMILPYENTIV